VTAVNDPFTNVDYLIYQIRYDTVHGVFPLSLSKKDDHTILVDGKHEVRVYTEKEPKNIPWGQNGSTIVCESTGVFLD